MQKTYVKIATFLSYLIAGCALIVSLSGLFIENLYRGTAFVVSTWLGNDLVTLIVAIPLLLGATILTSRGSTRARLVWLGLLDYMLYNYGFYLFGAAFNWFFFLYVILFASSIWALILVLLSLDVEQIAAGFTAQTPVRWIAGFMAVVGSMLTGVYFLQWLNFATSGDLPIIVEMSGHPTNLVFALDLTIVVPVMLVGAWLLWRRHPWGYVLAAMGNVKGVVYMLALSAATFTAFQAGTIDGLVELSLWLPIAAGSALAVIVQLRHYKAIWLA